MKHLQLLSTVAPRGALSYEHYDGSDDTQNAANLSCR
jgi:hypothetical protein